MIGQKPRIFTATSTNRTAHLTCKCPHCPAEIRVEATLEDGEWRQRWHTPYSPIVGTPGYYGALHKHQPTDGEHDNTAF